MKNKSFGLLFVALLVLTTTGHAVYRYAARQGPVLVSALSVGKPFPVLAEAPLHDGAPLKRGECRIVVVFSLACAYCHAAAGMEAAATGDDRLPVSWVSATSEPEEKAFASQLRRGTQLYLARDAKRKLKIQAVPAAFLVDEHDIIRRVWVYSGDEDHQELRAACE
jgi:hypothetical protein